MSKGHFRFEAEGNYIGGTFALPLDANGEFSVRCPGDLTDLVSTVPYSFSAVDHAVEVARVAFQKWKHLSHASRAEHLKNYQAALVRKEAELCEAISREMGKPLWEAKTEFSAMVNKVDISIKEGLRYQADFDLPQVMERTLGACRHKPHGVMAVVGPFNFPGHLANGHIVPALLTGNVVIFKPSEKAPIVGQIMAECFHDAGFPRGVFNLVQGEKEVGRRLCIHEGVSGVLFTGSYEVGTRIKQDTLLQHWKILALEMGGKNSSLVWKDANLDVAIYETLTSAFLTTGQRCSATSRILVHESLLDQFVEKFHARAKAFKIGHPLEKDQPFMGPIIDEASVDRYIKFIGIAEREGCEVVMRGKQLDLDYKGHYVTPSICLVRKPTLEKSQKSVYQQTELFAPNVAILPVSDLDEAIAQANVTQYGLAASVFTASRETYDYCWSELEAGIVNWNKSTVGASSRLPFGGLKKSGNHFPTALAAPLYCSYPVASLETEHPQLATTKNPGLNWE
jgi:succinylglutamic semialdehyde dehydrogenase